MEFIHRILSHPLVQNLALFVGKVGVLAAAALVILVGVVIAIAFLIAKTQNRNLLQVDRLDEEFQDIQLGLKAQMLEKDELKVEKKKHKEQSKNEKSKNLFVIDFKGDLHAHAVENLREEVTAILFVAKPTDEVVVKVQSPGGVVNGYGLAASQLLRIREKGIPLTVCVDEVAASGGYLMSCVANKIVTAPFAIVGSIGVVAQVPNFNRLLKKYDVDFKEYTAGEYKRTVTMLGEITPKGEEKFKAQLEDTHVLFKQFVSKYRSQLDLSKVATGEYWYGSQCIELGLVDELKTSDDYIIEQSETAKIFAIKYEKPEKLSEKISGFLGEAAHQALQKTFVGIFNKLNYKHWMQ